VKERQFDIDSVTNLNDLLNVNFAPNVSLQVCKQHIYQLLIVFCCLQDIGYKRILNNTRNPTAFVTWRYFC